MSLQLTIDTKEVNSLIDRAMTLGKTRSLMERTARVAHTDTTMNFRQSRDPDGNPWKPITSRKGKPLLDTGRLRNSIVTSVSDDEASIGTNVEYAATHQFGAVIKPKKGKYLTFKIGDRFVKKTSVVIPARPFLGFGERLVGRINRETANWAEEVLNGN